MRRAKKPTPVRRQQAVVMTDADGRVLMVRNAEGGLLKGLWDLPTVVPACEHVQAFSHFKLELAVLSAERTAQFVDPRAVPLTTAARKVLQRLGVRTK